MAVTALDYDPIAPDVIENPYPYYAALRASDPVRHLSQSDLWVVSRYADVRTVMHDNATFSSQAMAVAVTRPVLIAGEQLDIDPSIEGAAVSIIGTDGARHSRLRHIVNRGFTPRRIAELEPRVRRLARSYAQGLVASGGGDLQADFAVPFPTVVIAEMLGVDPEMHEQFRRWAEHMVLAVFDRPDEEQQAAILTSMVEMSEWLDAVVADREGGSGDDLLSVLLRAELDGGALERDELGTFFFTLLVAGSITTAYLVGNGMLALFDNEDAAAAVRSDPALVPGLVEEALRYDPPTQLMLRTAARDTDVAGVTIPQGATVAALLGSANRDESVFPQADRFDVGRMALDHLAFGHGVHHCLGAALARIEARIAFEELLGSTRVIRPAGPHERIRSFVFRGPTTLPVEAIA